MTLLKHTIRRTLKLTRRLPIHPQWLLGSRRINPVIPQLTGIVLDVGCADRWVEPYISRTARYIGLDYPPTGDALYRAKADLFADAAALPLKDGSVAAIICLEVLEHVRDHQAALREFNRVLKPKGQLILSMPFMYPTHDAPHDYQRLTEYGLVRDIQAAGLEMVDLQKRGPAIRSAALTFSLALAGGLYARGKLLDYLLMPLAALMILAVNLSALALSWVVSDWQAHGLGFDVHAMKP